MNTAYEKPKKYVPGPGDPVLPPQLTEFSNKTSDEVLKELNKMPFFMSQLDDDNSGHENVELEALKAMNYEGEPDEIAGNFKNQGNELFKIKRYKDAREYYTKGLEIDFGGLDRDIKFSELISTLFANRAACELELKNYRKCINDSKKSLEYNPKNIKAYYRIGKALFYIDKLEESTEAINFGLKFDPENKPLQSLLLNVNKKKIEKEASKKQTLAHLKEIERQEELLKASLDVRRFTNINTSHPADILKEAKMYLEEKDVVDSQLIFPAVVLYPTTDEFDFIAETGELSTPNELLQLVMQRPQEYFQQSGHENFSVKNLQVFMETEAGGLVKVGKNMTFHDILKTEKPVIPLFDRSLRVYFVPKQESAEWLNNWDKNAALERRSSSVVTK
ncbi:related to Hsp70/Hsp90 co-chaperone CNS1 [Saccharomycodes ludwigii]|uniref:Related to Hsp70/Hsp90 co-chaperone CNS1 n=1 Tax=Saccharomycodes ludwigii TaxID=36035 RepID=A0A376B9U4_9ASCO|nr:hypothetical protein SCDLUD_001978 [Saccharomycodes ludwigii]KAH3902164.1 hypothetical protein SCDLUD_001978 [Saccharomycodes ludwigii]SSD61427.1 related to Hsp70/Hsp90 co-chaperone CNS1 [Saccharomycodes ludwigii]